MKPGIDGTESLSARIEKKFAGLTPIPLECCIFKVHHQLRRVNENAYEPELLAIGPYHHGKDRLSPMEKHKLNCLQLMLKRRNESLEIYIEAMRKLEKSARRYYAESTDLTEDEFVEMLLLDGCFIIELFRNKAPIFQMDWMRSSLRRDLLLFENQLPFFVLTMLFQMTWFPTEPSGIGYLAFDYLCPSLPFKFNDPGSCDNIKHLLALIHEAICPPRFAGTRKSRKEIEWDEGYRSIHCATELREAGIRFRKLEKRNLFDIEFDNGVMKIPQLEIHNETECLIRNLVAYEQYTKNIRSPFITDYVCFMDDLISSPRDVGLLRQRGIILNELGDDEVVSTMFNKLRDNVSESNLGYTEVYKNVKQHCKQPWNFQKAKLRHNYFNSPWALISFLAALFLILQSTVQTGFNIASYFVHKS